MTLPLQVIVQRDLWFLSRSDDQLVCVPPHHPSPLRTLPSLPLFCTGDLWARAKSFRKSLCVWAHQDTIEASFFGAKHDLFWLPACLPSSAVIWQMCSHLWGWSLCRRVHGSSCSTRLQSFKWGFVWGCLCFPEECYDVVSHLETCWSCRLPFCSGVWRSQEFKVLFLLLLFWIDHRNRAPCGNIPQKSHVLLPCTDFIT